MKCIKPGQRTQLVGDIYPLPKGNYHFTWSILKGSSIASVDSKGVLSISSNAKPGDIFTVKTTAVVDDPNIQIKPSIVDYIVR
jgi:hypothetical protein